MPLGIIGQKESTPIKLGYQCIYFVIIRVTDFYSVSMGHHPFQYALFESLALDLLFGRFNQ
jgi:hypothetical protein